MADLIYGIQQSQPYDVFSYMKLNAPKLKLVGRTSFLPNLLNSEEVGLGNGMDFIISDKVKYYDEPMMNGQTRRYMKITGFLAQYSPTLGFSQSITRIQEVEEGIIQLGYTDIAVKDVLENGPELAAVLGINASRIGSFMKAAEVIEIRAGMPSYTNNSESILDAPIDSQNYVRKNGEWIVDDHNPHQDVNGGTATVS